LESKSYHSVYEGAWRVRQVSSRSDEPASGWSSTQSVCAASAHATAPSGLSRGREPPSFSLVLGEGGGPSAAQSCCSHQSRTARQKRPTSALSLILPPGRRAWIPSRMSQEGLGSGKAAQSTSRRANVDCGASREPRWPFHSQARTACKP